MDFFIRQIVLYLASRMPQDRQEIVTLRLSGNAIELIVKALKTLEEVNENT